MWTADPTRVLTAVTRGKQAQAFGFEGLLRLLVPGEYRDEQSPVLTLAQIDPLRVEVFVPTAYYGQIQVGTEAEVRPEKPVGGIYKATVTVVDRVLDAASGTFGVRLRLPNSTLLLPAGIRCKVQFEMRAPQSNLDVAQTTVTNAPRSLT